METYERWNTTGQCLRPIIVLIYMNSLPSQLTEGLLLQYADDTTIIRSGVIPAAVQTTMCSQLSLMQHWVPQSKMKILENLLSCGLELQVVSIDGVESTVTVGAYF